MSKKQHEAPDGGDERSTERERSHNGMKKTEIESIIKIKRKESRMSRHHRTYSADEKKKKPAVGIFRSVSFKNLR